MKKITLGLLLGLIAGIVDTIPMIFQGLTWDANISALSLWIIAGFLLATSNLKIKGVLKGILISFLILLPSAILIGWQEPTSLAPIIIMTLLLGSILGYLIEKFGGQKL
jgi:CHASE2 domain-containing sensor protein